MSKKLIIISDCLGPKGKHLSRGDKPEVEEARDVYALIATGRALDLDTAEGKAAAEEIAGEQREAAKSVAKK
jgi:hypothetical protein